MVGSGGNNFAATYRFDAAQWRVLKQQKPEKGYKVRAGAIKISIKPGKVLKVSGKGSVLPETLNAQPDRVSVVLNIGGHNICLQFDGGRFKQGRKLTVQGAAAPVQCLR